MTKTINIGGKSVEICYCAAAEIGYENLTGKSSYIFIPDDSKPKATIGDYVNLAVSSIISAYEANDRAVPEFEVSGTKKSLMKYLMFYAKPQEIIDLVNTVGQLRAEWYRNPSINEENEASDDDAKN